MSNVIQFPRPYMGPPGIGKSDTLKIVMVANPGYWPEGQLGVTFYDTTHGTGAGVTWAYKHGWYSGQWMFHGSQDEPDAFYGTCESYVPKAVRDMAAPIIAAYPPFHPTAYHEDYV